MLTGLVDEKHLELDELDEVEMLEQLEADADATLHIIDDEVDDDYVDEADANE